MSAPSVSYFDVEGDSVVPGPVPVAPFHPGSGNVFPKFVDRLSDTAWELWYFDGGSDDGKTAFTVSFFRDARGLKEGGWRAQVFALWPDGTTWNNELHFAESIVTADGGFDGRIHGVWRARDDDDSAVSFTIEPDCSAATLRFKVPQRVEGTVVLRALDGNRQGLPSSESAALLCPDMYYLRPISLAEVVADLVFHSAGMSETAKTTTTSESAREFKFVSCRGGMDRCWTPLSWPQLLSESYFLRAQVGPYDMQLMRILSPGANGRKPYATACLWKDQKLVCAAQQVILPADLERPSSEGKRPAEDAIAIEKVYEDDGGRLGVTGAFRDKNVGYIIQFIGRGKGMDEPGSSRSRWRFEVRHVQPWWNMQPALLGPTRQAIQRSWILSLVAQKARRGLREQGAAVN
jgi:hypothetical protein